MPRPDEFADQGERDALCAADAKVGQEEGDASHQPISAAGPSAR